MKTVIKTPGSSAIQKVSYDDKSMILTVTMAYEPPRHHGEVLRYLNVPEDTAKKFMEADSKGKYFNNYIRDYYQLE